MGSMEYIFAHTHIHTYMAQYISMFMAYFISHQAIEVSAKGIILIVSKTTIFMAYIWQHCPKSLTGIVLFYPYHIL